MPIIKFPFKPNLRTNTGSDCSWYTKRLVTEYGDGEVVEWMTNVNEYIGDTCTWCNENINDVCQHCSNTKKLTSITIDSYIHHGFTVRRGNKC